MNVKKQLARAVTDAGGYLADAVTRERIVFYVCDPAKNPGCGKMNCRITSSEEFGFCSSTPDPACRAAGTRPFYKRLNSDGYFGREYIREAKT